MGEFGAYDRVKQIDHAGVVWTARIGDGPAQFVVKFCPGPNEPGGSAAAVAALRTSAELQKGIFDSKSPGWGPILAIGKTVNGGAYYVAPIYPTTGQKLIEQHHAFTSDELKSITDQVAEAMATVKSLYGRGYGNLKPGNVLFTDANVRKAKALLFNPAPLGSPAATDTTADRRGLGRLIFELVTGLQFGDYNWPIRTGKKWEELGPDGAKWLDRCNHLLAPAGGATAWTLDQFREDLNPKPLKRSGASGGGGGGAAKIAAAVVLALAAAGGGYVYMHRGAGPVATPIGPDKPISAPGGTTPVTTPVTTPPTPQPTNAPSAPPAGGGNNSIAGNSSGGANTSSAGDSSSAVKPPPAASGASTPTPVTPSTPPSATGTPASPVPTPVPVAQTPPAAVPPPVGGPTPEQLAAIQAQKDLEIAKAANADKQAKAVAALGAAEKRTFKHDAVNQSFHDFVAGLSGETDADKALAKVAAVSDALAKADAAMTDGPLGAGADASVMAAYNGMLKSALHDLAQGTADHPENEAAAVGQFNTQMNALRDAGTKVAGAFGAVADADAAMKGTTLDPAAFARIKQRLTDAGAAPAGWPDAHADQALGRIAPVMDVLASKDINSLQRYANAGGPPPVLLAVCANWPAVHGDAEVDEQIYQSVKKGLSSVPAATVKSVSDLWVSRAAGETDPDRAGRLLQLADLMDLPVKGQPLAITYFNARLADLKKTVTDQTPAGQQSDATKNFLAQIAPLSGGQWALADPAKSAVAKLSTDLKLGLIPQLARKMPAHFIKDPGSDDLIFTPAFDPNHPIRFKKVKNKTTGESFYMATTEATVGFFVGLLDDPHKIVVLRRAMDFTLPAKLGGPSAWRTNFIRGGMEVNADASWLASKNHFWDNDQTLYVPRGGGPTVMTPVQYISPLAAMYGADLVGCRLPTVDEWQSAYESNLRDDDDNSSGGNWDRLRGSIAALTPPAASVASWQKFKAEIGLEDPAGNKIPYAGAVRDGANEKLWYREAPPGTQLLHDMKGNVSEWVLTSSIDAPAPRLENDDPITVDDEDGSHLVASQDDSSLATFYRHCMRIGLASTSGRDVDPEKPEAPLDPTSAHHNQYWDVGFRLALDDPTIPPRATLSQLVQGAKAVGG